MFSERTSEQAFFGVSALLFAASAAVTIVWCASMSTMGGMRLAVLGQDSTSRRRISNAVRGAAKPFQPRA